MPLPTAAFLCCRDHDLFAPVEEYALLICGNAGDPGLWNVSYRGAFERISKTATPMFVINDDEASDIWMTAEPIRNCVAPGFFRQIRGLSIKGTP
jgi:hypothetical protein